MSKNLYKIIGILILLYGLLPALQTQAQNDRVRYIADMVTYVKDKINQEAYEKISLSSNNTGLSSERWKDFDGTETYHYIAINSGSDAFLRLVVIETTQAEKKYRAEFLYNNDYQLMFYKEELEGFADVSHVSFEVYFGENGEPIEVWENGEVITSIMLIKPENFDVIQAEGQLYAEVFKEVLLKGKAQK